MIVLSQFLRHRDTLVSKREDIREGLEHFYQENVSDWGGRTADAKDISRRIVALEGFLKTYLTDAN